MFLNKFKRAKRIKKFILFVLVVLISFSSAKSVFGWTAPSAIPPNSNVPTPLNISSTAQTKTGTLTVGGFDLSGNGNEGDISNLNYIKGYNDLILQGDTGASEEIWIDSFSANDHKLVFKTTSTVRMTIDKDGKIKIGTGSPSYTLDVAGDINLTGTLSINDSPITTGYWSQTGSDIYYNTGDIGIGTTNPDQPLHIGDTGIPGSRGVIRVASEITGGGANRAWEFGTAHDADAPYDFFIKDGSLATSSFMIEYGTGNVGIGTLSPDANYRLTVTGGGIKSDSTSNPAGYFSSSSGYGLIVNSGNVGIGTASPASELHIYRETDDYGTAGLTIEGAHSRNDARLILKTVNAGREAMVVHTDGTNIWYSGLPYNAGGATSEYIISPTINRADAKLLITSTGDVGIGTTPGYKLDVAGTVRFTGKLTVPTIDPQYEINGNIYGYYISDYAGSVRMNVTGKAELVDSIYIIDFDNLEEGSELWLFAQKTDLGEEMEKLIVLLTPEARKAILWYEVVYLENRLIIYGDKDTVFSYRLSAPRYDWQDHSVLIGPAN